MRLIDKRTPPSAEMINSTIDAINSVTEVLLPITPGGETLLCSAHMVTSATYDYSQMDHDDIGWYIKRGSNMTPYTMGGMAHQSVYYYASAIRYLANDFDCSGGRNWWGTAHYADLRNLEPEELIFGTWTPPKSCAAGKHQYGLDPSHPLYPDPYATPVIWSPCIQHIGEALTWYYTTTPDTGAVPDLNEDGTYYYNSSNSDRGPVQGNRITVENWTAADHDGKIYKSNGDWLDITFGCPNDETFDGGWGWDRSPTNAEFCLCNRFPIEHPDMAGTGGGGNYVGAAAPEFWTPGEYISAPLASHVNLNPVPFPMPTAFKHYPKGTNFESAKIRVRFNGIQFVEWSSSRHYDGTTQTWVVDSSEYSVEPLQTGLILLGYKIDPVTGASSWESLGFSFSDDNAVIEPGKWQIFDATEFCRTLLTPEARVYKAFTLVPALASSYFADTDLRSTLRGMLPSVSYAHFEESPYPAGPPAIPGWAADRPWGVEGSAEVSNSGWFMSWDSVEVSHIALHGIQYPESELGKVVQLDNLPPMH